MKQIDVLPDDVLLEIFDFYVDMNPWDVDEVKPGLNSDMVSWIDREEKMGIQVWQSLVHVCRRWRSLVFESPRRLNLQLYCSPETPAKDTLDVWPALPLIVKGNIIALISDTDNVIAALGQSSCVCQVDLDLADLQVEKVLAPMQVPFPELTYLRLASYPTADLPDSFLGGSAPRLRYFELFCISFPGLPKLLLSANRLVNLRLLHFPRSGYNSPEAMAAILSVLSSLETLSLQFQSRDSRPDWESRSLPPPKRSILPALYEFCFEGVAEYLEELVARIDTPQLDRMDITFFYQVDFDCPRLAQFINRAPSLGARDKAHVQIGDWRTSVVLLAQSRTFEIVIPWGSSRHQLSPVAQVCSSLHPLSTVEDLYIERQSYERALDIYAIENTQWLQIFLPFIAVKNLYLSEQFVPYITPALQELVGGRITEVLPSLQNIFVKDRFGPLGPFQEFAAARRHSGHPIAIVWNGGRM
jgi:hypothetical protein